MIGENGTFKNKITDEEMSLLPMNSFPGSIHLIERADQVNAAIEYLNNQDLLGFDTETKPSFAKGQNNPVSLLQLSTTDRAFLFRISRTGLPKELVKILSSSKIIKIGVAIRDDIKILQRITPFKPSSFIDLQEIVGNYGIENFSLKKLSAIVLGFRISKAQRLTNWDAAELTEPQLLYAATDAWAALGIYSRLLEMQNDSIPLNTEEKAVNE
jgi:ribonuclease D